MCHLPACDRACPTGTEPSGIIQSLHLENEEGARRQAAARTQCLTCEVPRCEQACARKHTDHALHIREICRTLVAEASHSCTLRTVDELPAQTPDLALSFCGVRCQNPFFLASSPVASSFDMCRRAFDAGWAGISYKTISFYHSREVSPRFDSLPASRPATFGGFKNLEQLSPRPAEENFDILSRLKAEYPEKVIIASIMGQTEEEWTRLARMTEEAGADLIECNFSCPQMARQGLGSDIGQDPELIARYTRATRQGSRLPIIAKMTPNIGNMELPAMAATANGADALAAINTIKSITRIHTGNFSSYPDIAGRSAVGGYSGRAVKPIALRFVRDLAAIRLWQAYLCSASEALPPGAMRWTSCCWDVPPYKCAPPSWSTATASSTTSRKDSPPTCNSRATVPWTNCAVLPCPTSYPLSNWIATAGCTLSSTAATASVAGGATSLARTADIKPSA